jgi:hypothetical protein
MRPTWHFVAPADIRWLLSLTSPRVHAVNASFYRKLELDAAVLARSATVLRSALQGGDSQVYADEQAKGWQDARFYFSDRFHSLIIPRAGAS